MDLDFANFLQEGVVIFNHYFCTKHVRPNLFKIFQYRGLRN